MADVSLPQWLATQGAVLLLGAAGLGMLALRLGVPYAAALVLGGLLIEGAHITGMPRLDPGVLLFGFLPPLLFDAAFGWTSARRDRPGGQSPSSRCPARW